MYTYLSSYYYYFPLAHSKERLVDLVTFGGFDGFYLRILLKFLRLDH